MIIHCMKKEAWKQAKNKEYWGEDDIRRYGFIHCSTVPYLWRVLPGFEDTEEDMVLLCIDERKLVSELLYEDDESYKGRYYPHVYGPINRDAVVVVLDYLKDHNGHYRKNPELYHIADE